MQFVNVIVINATAASATAFRWLQWKCVHTVETANNWQGLEQDTQLKLCQLIDIA